MNLRSVTREITDHWARIISSNRDLYFLTAAGGSSLIAFAPFARETSISDFFIYALLPIVLVLANREKAARVPPPSEFGLAISFALVSGSFAFNFVTGSLTGDYTFGLTDYIILVVGIFSAFYSIETVFAKTGALLLVALRGATLGLSIAYAEAFVSVSAFFVTIVVAFSKIFVSPEIAAGPVAGQIIVGGMAVHPVAIGWACAGLEELALITVILYILIFSFDLPRQRAVIWLIVGIAGSFMINIFRMVLLVWIAYTHGNETMVWVHTHLGDVLFLIWIAAFWLLFFRYLDHSSSPMQCD